MRIAYLDCFSGVSGDMFLGALVDAGVSAHLLRKSVEGLGIDARLEISKVLRSGIAATKVDVYAHGEKDRPRLSGSARIEPAKDGSPEIPTLPAKNAGRMGRPTRVLTPHGHTPHEHDSHEHEPHEHGRSLAEIK